MADIKVIVKQMKEAGMTEQDIVDNLKDLGIENAEEEMSKVLREMEGDLKQEPLKITRVKGDSEREVEVENSLENSEEPDIMKKVAASNISNVDEMEDKLDQIISLLKSMQTLNKQILETNRDVLMKLSRKTSEGNSRPTLGKIL